MLKDLRGNSGGTTWLVMAVVACVLGVFVVTVGVLRFSRIRAFGCVRISVQ